MLVPNRYGNSPAYRYGFNSMEKDDELKGEGNSLNYEARMHDPRVGRFLSLDPLTKQFPWYSPYQFAGNTPISSVDLDGLEVYFAADGSFLGQSIHGGTQIRIANKFTPIKLDVNGKISKGYQITSSQALSQFDIATQKKVYQTIYNREINEGATILAEKDDTRVSKGANTPGGGGKPITVNSEFMTYTDQGSEYGNEYYYNVTNNLKHENKHFKGKGGGGFDHFEIWKAQINDASYSKTTQGYKNFLERIGLNYIDNMETTLMSIDDYKNVTQQQKNSAFNEYYSTYLERVDYYNKTYNKDYKPASKNDLRTKSQIINIRNRK